MAAIIFPSNPTLNTVVNFGNRYWKWNGSVWESYRSSTTGSGTPTSGDVEVTDPTKGVIIRDLDDNRWRITVDTDGGLITTRIQE
jgi:hypothetical protein